MRAIIQNRARRVLNALNADREADAPDLDAAVAEFERDMAPVRDAIVEALEAGDVDALKGLRAMLPGLLHEVNRDPALADLMACSLGKAMLAGLGGGSK